MKNNFRVTARNGQNILGTVTVQATSSRDAIHQASKLIAGFDSIRTICKVTLVR